MLGRALIMLCTAAAMLFAEHAHAYTCLSNASGSWTAPATWVNCGGGTPGVLDDVQIRNAHAVTIPNDTVVAALSVTFTISSGAAALTHGNGGSRIAVGGSVTMNASGTNAIRYWNINAGSATVGGGVTLVEGSTNSRISRINITTGNLTVGGNLAMTNAGNAVRTVVNVSGAGNITVNGGFTLSAGLGTLTASSTSTFTYASPLAASVATGPSITYGHVVVNKFPGTATTLDAPGAPRAFTVAGNLAITTGTLNISNVTATIGGTTTVSGTLGITGATGTKTFAGLLTVNSGAVWNNTAHEDIVLQGGITNYGTFGSGTGVYAFAANNQALNGIGIAFDGNVQIDARVVLTNNIATTINGNFAGGGAGAATGTFTNAVNSTLNIAGDMAGLSTLDASATNNTVNYSGPAVRTAKFTSYYHLAVSSSGTVTLAGDTTIAGNLTTNGYFDPSANSRLVTFNGTVPQNVIRTGGATNLTFYNLALNNTSSGVVNQTLTTGLDLTINNQLTLLSGRIVTTGDCLPGACIKVVIPASGLIAGATGSPNNRFIAGRLQKFVNNGNPVVTFEVGTNGAAEPALGYSPITMAFSFVAGLGGNLMAYARLNDHPNIATSTLDPTRSVNRYWTLAISGSPGDLGAFTSDMTLNFVNLSPSVTDVDATANPLNFEIERWDGALWQTAVYGVRTLTSTQVLTVTTLGDFAVAEKTAGGSPTGGFNAMDVPTCAVTGFIRTKVAGASVTLNIVALQNPPVAIKTNFNGVLRVEIVDSSNAGLTCATWPQVQLLADVTFSTTDKGCKATAPFTVANSWPNARVRITENPGKPSQLVACSSDNFAMRPDAIVNVQASDASWDTAGTSRSLADTTFGTVTHKAGRPFTVRATAVNAAVTPAVTSNYSGSPTALLGACAGAACTATQGALTVNTSFSAGQLAVDTASYAEVGSFTLELRDMAFANVDAADGTPADCSATGRYVCQRPGPAAAGRFVPDHFTVAYNAPSFATACAPGQHTYLGQPFGYAVAPVITVTARNASAGTTALYTGTHWRITEAVLAASGNKSYSTAAGTLITSAAPTPDPVVVPGSNGIGSLSFASGAGFSFLRTTPVAPFDAEVSLAINVVDADNVTYTANPARFGLPSAGNGIPFTSGKAQRFGRLVIGSANGSQLVLLRMGIETQYWTGASFVTHTADSCTAVAATTLGLLNYTGNLGATPSCETATMIGGSFVAGRGTLRLAAPGHGNDGSVDVTVNLSGAASGSTCLAVGVPPGSPTMAGMSYLQVRGGSGAYDQNPRARARFGVYRATEEFIDLREVF